MLTIEHDDRVNPAWQDPRISLGRTQFEHSIGRLEKLLDADVPDEQVACRLADTLCESSRDLLFRLHRIRMSDLKQIIALFEHAAAAVRRAIDGPVIHHPQRREDVAGYLSHIEGRIRLLKKHVE